MYYDTLNSEQQVSYLIKPIIEVLQEAGGQLERSEIRDRISEKDEYIAEFEQKIYTSIKTGNQYKKFDFKFNFALKELSYVGYLMYEKYKPLVTLTAKGAAIDLDAFDVKSEVREKAAVYWEEKAAKNKDKKANTADEIEEDNKFDGDDVLDDVKVKLQSAIANMSPKKFEQFSRALLTKMGIQFTDKGVKISNDGGIDGYGYHTDDDDFRTTRVVIQCKRYNTAPVSEPDINQFLGAMNKFQADYGVFITNSRFTNAARIAAREGTPITLIDGNDLIRLVIKYETICNDPQVCRIVDLPVYYELETNNDNRDYRIQIGGHYMNYNTVYVGMDVHKESFTLCSCKYEDEKASHYQRTPASYKNVLRYLAFLRTIYGEDTRFVCGYEAGCLGYSLYHQLENFNVECVILAPTTMLEQRSKRRIKTDKRDAEIIAKSLAQHNYSPVHIPTETDNQTKEFIRMRDDHKAELKKIKQQILAFCLRQGYQYDGSGNWTAKHVKWLRSLKTEGLYKEILDEYLLTYTILTDKLNRLDQRIEELASEEEYKEPVSKLTCFLGIKTHTALSVIVEVGDFQRFASARKFAGYLGLVPGQHSSGDDRNGLGITKAGNTHVRRLLVESAQSYTRGKIGYKSRVLRSRQAGNSPQIINYADRANERLRRRYYQMILKDGKKYNIAKIAVARELACFIWGMMTDNIY